MRPPSISISSGIRRLLTVLGASFLVAAFAAVPAWPEATSGMKPWAINHWLGSAVDETNLTRELTRYRDAGLGGIRIVPIYEAKGYESNSIPYLSPRWMDMLKFTRATAARLGLGVDMSQGSGWCFGGPTITPDRGIWRLALAKSRGRLPKGATILYHDKSVILAAAPSGFKVKRAGPGGAGLMLNPMDPEAMRQDLAAFSAFDAPGAARPDRMFHDSFEYFGAGWSKSFFDDFRRLRGYDLRDHLAAFAGRGPTDDVARVKHDYRETVSDLIMDEVFPQWVAWCRARGIATVNQAHGACANLLDFYAISDQPETEMFGRGKRDPLRSGFDGSFRDGGRDVLFSKFASSAAHLAGRPVVSAESGTWMAEHFCGTLEELKALQDLFFLAGVNRVYYHAVCYSPDSAPWPGWCFYASSEINPRNPIWRDLPALDAYVTRCQSLLQTSAPDNDILLYWPVHDLWSEPEGYTMMLAVGNNRLAASPFGQTARRLDAAGYAFDYVSDRLLAASTVTNGTYSTIIVPPCRYLPATTFARLLGLARGGLTVLFMDHIPLDQPGFVKVSDQCPPKLDFTDAAGFREAHYGKGTIRFGDLDAMLRASPARRESFKDSFPALDFVRLRRGGDALYFLVNSSTNTLAFALPAAATTLDPLTGSITSAVRTCSLPPAASIFVQTAAARTLPLSPCAPVSSRPVYALAGPWRLEFIAGGPVLPPATNLTALADWASFGGDYERFSGTARYTATFDCPAPSAGRAFLLSLGAVKQSARVRLNGHDLGVAFMLPYRLAIPAGVLRERGNVLEVEVTNLGANRIRDLDRRHVEWKLFHDANVVSITYKPFDASKWPVFPSGLLGPVTLEVAP